MSSLIYFVGPLLTAQGFIWLANSNIISEHWLARSWNRVAICICFVIIHVCNYQSMWFVHVYGSRLVSTRTRAFLAQDLVLTLLYFWRLLVKCVCFWMSMMLCTCVGVCASVCSDLGVVFDRWKDFIEAQHLLLWEWPLKVHWFLAFILKQSKPCWFVDDNEFICWCSCNCINRNCL